MSVCRYIPPSVHLFSIDLPCGEQIAPGFYHCCTKLLFHSFIFWTSDEQIAPGFNHCYTKLCFTHSCLQIKNSNIKYFKVQKMPLLQLAQKKIIISESSSIAIARLYCRWVLKRFLLIDEHNLLTVEVNAWNLSIGRARTWSRALVVGPRVVWKGQQPSIYCQIPCSCFRFLRSFSPQSLWETWRSIMISEERVPFTSLRCWSCTLVTVLCTAGTARCQYNNLNMTHWVLIA